MGVMGRAVKAVRAAMGVPSRRFSESAPLPIDRLILQLMGSGSTSVGRQEALSVPAVLKGRNLICSISTLPLVQYGPANTVVPSSFLAQIDRDVPNVVTLAQTLEDLMFEGIAWWRITEFAHDGYPMYARRLDPSTVSLDPPSGRSPAPLPSGWDPRESIVYVDGQPVRGSEIIRFDSPNPPILKVGGRAIRKALLLDKLASTYADDPRPLDYFTPTEHADPEDDEVLSFLDRWKAARKKRSTAFVPGALKYNTVSAPSPSELQLVELQKQAGLEIANELGVDPEELGISTTSRTYANATDRRKDRINDVLAPYMRAITDRLSMGDVTKRGHGVRFELDDYMKPDPKTRVEVQKAYLEMGVMTVQQIAAEEGLPAPVAEAPAKPATDDQGDEGGAEASRGPRLALVGGGRRGFSAGPAGPGVRADGEQGPAMVFAGGDFAGGGEPAVVDAERRTITGLALPYNKIARKYGFAFRFRPGALQYADISRVKHYKDHWVPVGVHESVKDSSRGPVVKLRVLDGPEGSPAKLERDQLLYDAQHGLYDGLSVGVDFSLDPKDGDVEWDEKDQVYNVLRATWRETSSTPMPAFDDARVTKVAASRRGNGDPTMPCTTCGQVHAEGVACTAPSNPPTANQPDGVQLSQDQLTALLARPGAIQALVAAQQAAAAAPASAAPAAPAGGLTFTAEQVDGLIRGGQLGVLLGMPQLTPAPAAPTEQRQTVDPTRRTATLSVREEMPYRFDRKGNLTKGAYDFSTDLVSGARGDGEALARSTRFVREQFEERQTAAQFDTDKADVAALNPSRQRPDLYVDQQEFATPIWDAIYKGTIADATPFVLPKFNTASGLVGTHTEATGPTAGVYTATSQTITPVAMSGRVEVTREAWEQGGNPQLSGIIWRQMLRAWNEALEAAAVAMLDALTPTSLGTLTAGGGTTGQTLVAELTGHLASLQFARGGFRMRDFFGQIDLYKALIGALDADGRPLLPQLGAVNSNGQAQEFWSDVLVGGLRLRPSWALAASGAVAASSYLFDRADVHGWASAPQRLQFEYRTEYVDVAIWGYRATANTDITGVREVIYDPVL